MGLHQTSDDLYMAASIMRSTSTLFLFSISLVLLAVNASTAHAVTNNSATFSNSALGGTLLVGGNGGGGGLVISNGAATLSFAGNSGSGLIVTNTATFSNSALGGTLLVGGNGGGGGLVISNSGSLNLTASNSYSGGITLGGGTLQVGSGSLSLGGSTNFIGSNTLNLGSGGLITTNSTNSLTITNKFPIPTNPPIFHYPTNTPVSPAPIVTVVYSTKDIVPGASTNAYFTSFGNPAFNDYNHVAFQATVSEVTQYPIVYAMAGQSSLHPIAVNSSLPKFTNTWSGIWAQNQSGNLQLVVRTTPTMMPDIGGFTSFSNPVYNNSNSVAFVGKYSPGFIYIPFPSGSNSTNTFRGGTGVWTSSSLTNPLNPVAFVGEVAPGCLRSNTFRSFDQIALPDQGGVVMLATINNGNQTQQGIWAQDIDGVLKLIARQGGIINVRGKNKTIASLLFLDTTAPLGGQSRHFSQDTGNLIFRATFTDGTQSLVKVIFP